MANRVESQMAKSAWIGMGIGVIGMLIGLVATYMQDVGAGIFFTIMIIGVGAIVWYSSIKPFAEQNRIRKNGIPAQATIVSLEENGSSIKYGGGLPKAGVVITLQVHPTNAPAYEAKTVMYISALDVLKYQPGTVVAVKYDQMNPQNVAIISE